MKCGIAGKEEDDEFVNHVCVVLVPPYAKQRRQQKVSKSRRRVPAPYSTAAVSADATVREMPFRCTSQQVRTVRRPWFSKRRLFFLHGARAIKMRDATVVRVTACGTTVATVPRWMGISAGPTSRPDSSRCREGAHGTTRTRHVSSNASSTITSAASCGGVHASPNGTGGAFQSALETSDPLESRPCRGTPRSPAASVVPSQ